MFNWGRFDRVDVRPSPFPVPVTHRRKLPNNTYRDEVRIEWIHVPYVRYREKPRDGRGVQVTNTRDFLRSIRFAHRQVLKPLQHPRQRVLAKRRRRAANKAARAARRKAA